jgi:hypothetical protein
LKQHRIMNHCMERFVVVLRTAALRMPGDVPPESAVVGPSTTSATAMNTTERKRGREAP